MARALARGWPLIKSQLLRAATSGHGHKARCWRARLTTSGAFRQRQRACFARSAGRSEGAAATAPICAVSWRKLPSCGFHCHDHAPSPPSRWRTSCGVEARDAPIVIIGTGMQASHLPAGQRRRWARASAPSRKQNSGDAAFCRGQIQPAAGHQIQAFGLPPISSSSAPTCGQARMSAAADSASAALAARTRTVVRDRRPAPASPWARARHIPSPHNPAAPRTEVFCPPPGWPAGGKAAGAPVLGKDFMQGAGPQAPAQHGIGAGHAQRKRRPVGGQAIARQEMAQFRHFFLFVHVMF